MNNKKQKLELTWIGKDKQPILEPRILIENPEFSYPAEKPPNPLKGEQETPNPLKGGNKAKPSSNSSTESKISTPPVKGAGGFSSNLLIKGDNLLALKALEQDYAGKVKCIYIDPPYNTGNAFEHYDDGLEHSLWLGLMRDRLVLLRTLLSEDGVIFVQIDDKEQAYLKIMMDEIFGRDNFICTFIWEARSGQGNTVEHISEGHEYVLCYAKNEQIVSFNKIENVAKEGNYSDV